MEEFGCKIVFVCFKICVYLKNVLSPDRTLPFVDSVLCAPHIMTQRYLSFLTSSVEA